MGARLVELGYDPAYSFTVRHGNLRRLDAPAETMNWAASAHHDGDLLRLETPALVDVGAVGKGALADLVSDLLDGSRNVFLSYPYSIRNKEAVEQP